MKSIFEKSNAEAFIEKVQSISHETKAKWGKMDGAQMCAHCNMVFEASFDKNQPKPNFLMRLMVKIFAKETIIGNKPYKQNSPTAPAFVITDQRKLEKEKEILIENILKAKDLGPSYFEGKEHPVFGSLKSEQWNTMLVKHLEHHLEQFGV